IILRPTCLIPSSCIRKSRRIPLGFNKKPEKSRPASMRLRKAGLSGFPVISYLQNRSISPKRPFFHNRKPMQKGDIAAVQRDPKDKTLRLQAAGNKSNQSNESDGRFAPILGRDAPRSRRSGS
ncbi:hypothetical protein, partial [Alistipes putredinis]|uniref:hypothetical protein n=1 Tax=Alistipes putredinis TaxID=28117 RepID=UPI003AAADC49